MPQGGQPINQRIAHARMAVASLDLIDLDQRPCGPEVILLELAKGSALDIPAEPRLVRQR